MFHGDTIEIIVRDGSMRKVEKWMISLGDKKQVQRLACHMKEKYGFSCEVSKIERNTPQMKKEIDILNVEMNL